MNDQINNPSHYKSKGIEAIDVIEAFELNFRLGNTIKYILRSGKKGNAKQCLEKARWYLDREIKNHDNDHIAGDGKVMIKSS